MIIVGGCACPQVFDVNAIKAGARAHAFIYRDLPSSNSFLYPSRILVLVCLRVPQLVFAEDYGK